MADKNFPDGIPWEELKARYISSNISYRKLASEFGISYNTIFNRAKKERWTELQGEQTSKTAIKIANRIGNRKAERFSRAMDISDKLMDKLEKAIAQLEDENGRVDTQELYDLIRGFQKLMASQGIKSDLDTAEQEARIAKLQKETEDDSGSDVVVTMEGGTEEWAK